MIDSQKKGTLQVGHPQVGVTASEVTGFISDSGQVVSVRTAGQAGLWDHEG